MKITIACPTNRGFQPQTFQCLCDLVNYSKELDLHIIVPEEGYTIAENRNYSAVQAVRNESEYILMIDDDMTFTPDTLDRLLDNDKPICGVPFRPRCEVEDMKVVDKTHYTKCKGNKLIEAKAGTGIMLIKTEIFKSVPAPWFFFTFYDNGACKMGEDWGFCEKAKEYNFKSYIDPRIEVGHIGEVSY